MFFMPYAVVINNFGAWLRRKKCFAQFDIA
jgi:hypothetical protein